MDGDQNREKSFAYSPVRLVHVQFVPQQVIQHQVTSRTQIKAVRKGTASVNRVIKTCKRLDGPFRRHKHSRTRTIVRPSHHTTCSTNDVILKVLQVWDHPAIRRFLLSSHQTIEYHPVPWQWCRPWGTLRSTSSYPGRCSNEARALKSVWRLRSLHQWDSMVYRESQIGACAFRRLLSREVVEWALWTSADTDKKAKNTTMTNTYAHMCFRMHNQMLVLDKELLHRKYVQRDVRTTHGSTTRERLTTKFGGGRFDPPSNFQQKTVQKVVDTSL